MGIRLIKNVSPAKIKVNISIQKNDGTNLNLYLNYGESILAQDTEVSTKSLIIQKKKGNVDIIDHLDVSGKLNLYQIYSNLEEKNLEDLRSEIDEKIGEFIEKNQEEPGSHEEYLEVVEIIKEVIKPDELKPVAETPNIEIPNIAVDSIIKPVTEQIVESVVVKEKNKGGRPKGSPNKKKKRSEER